MVTKGWVLTRLVEGLLEDLGEAVDHGPDELLELGALEVLVEVLVLEEALQVDGGLLVAGEDLALLLDDVEHSQSRANVLPRV